MDVLISVFLPLLLIAALVGCVLGWIGFFRTGKLMRRVETLEQLLQGSRTSEQTSSPTGDTLASPPLPELRDDDPEPEPLFELPEEVPNPLTEHLKSHWMIWLGGICVGLAGVFLVRYSIERGLLGPSARIVAGVISGLVLHAAALWLQRRHGAQPAFAALAGGASLILFAVLLAANQLYSLLSPLVTFVMLAAVSVLTMLLSLRHGPILAMLGLLGGYVVPLLVSSEQASIGGALIYSLLITASALLLMRYVFRPWLWIGMLVGALGWWGLSLFAYNAEMLRGPYLAALAWMLLALPGMDFLLRAIDQVERTGWSLDSLRIGKTLAQVGLLLPLGLLVIAQGVSITTTGVLNNGLLYWGPLTALVLLAAARRDTLLWLPWLGLAVQIIAWLTVAGIASDWQLWPVKLTSGDQSGFLVYAAWMTLLHGLVAGWQLRRDRNIPIWSAMFTLSPLLWLALGWLLTDQSAFTWRWALATLTLGLIYSGTAAQRLIAGKRDGLTVWLTIGAHAAWALAATLIFKQAGLTLVLAVMIVSLAFVIHRFQPPGLHYALKIVVGVIVLRLTLHPWLIDYSVTSHWSLWSYGGATICCAIAAWRLRNHTRMARWLELATLHLLVLTIWAEVRYWLYDGDLFVAQYGFVEAAINVNLLVALALIYRWRSAISEHLGKLYQLAANVLLVLSALNYILLVTLLNPLWNSDAVGATPIWNMLLPAYGLPVVGALLVAHHFPALHRRIAAPLAFVAAFVFINLEIRHLWNDGLSMHDRMSDGELYTYSIVWLLIAVVTMLYARSRENVPGYRAGIALLGLVIVKLFLIDMAGLEGLLRVASFMGLGLSLLGLGWLLQRFDQPVPPQTTEPEADH